MSEHQLCLGQEAGADLRGLRKAAERCAGALERIAAALEGVSAPAAAETSGPCLHPAEARVDFGTTHGVEDFLCRDCGFRSVPQPQTADAPAAEPVGASGG